LPASKTIPLVVIKKILTYLEEKSPKRFDTARDSGQCNGEQQE